MTAAWLVLASHAMADDFTVADFTIRPGETKTISVELNNTDNEYIAFDFYMSLPEGVSILEDEEGYLLAELNSDRCSEDFELTASKLEDGSYRFICYSFPFTTLNGSSGEILTITVTAAETAVPATGTGTLFSQVLSTPDKTQVEFEDFNFVVDIGLLGDVNRDKTVTVSDVTALVNIILGKDDALSHLYDYDAADLNGDGGQTIVDVTALVNLILGK